MTLVMLVPLRMPVGLVLMQMFISGGVVMVLVNSPLLWEARIGRIISKVMKRDMVGIWA